MIPPIMKEVQNTLESLGLSVVASHKEAKVPYGVCIVDLGIDEYQNPVALQVLLYSEENENPSTPPLQVLSFVMTIPAAISEEHAYEVMRLIALANKSIPLGCINYSEVEKSTYYTYSLPVFSESPAAMMLLTIVHTAIFVKETFFTPVYEVASGRTSIAQLLNEADQPA